VTRLSRAAITLVAVASIARPALGQTSAAGENADACAVAPRTTAGLLPAGTTAADFGTVAEPCGLSELTLRARGAFLIAPDMPDYYGSIIGDSLVRVRRRVTARGWLSFGLDVVTYRYVNNGGLASQGTSFGPATLGYHRTLLITPRLAAAAHVRALLPLDTSRTSGVETGVELGASARRLLPHRFALEGGLTLAAPLDLVGGQRHGRLEPAAAVELWLAASPRLGVGAGATARVALAPAWAFITAVPRGAARFALGPPRGAGPDRPRGQPFRRISALRGPRWMHACVEIRDRYTSAPRTHAEDQDEVEQQRKEALQADRHRTRQA
jgi:hypothetical protein